MQQQPNPFPQNPQQQWPLPLPQQQQWQSQTNYGQSQSYYPPPPQQPPFPQQQWQSPPQYQPPMPPPKKKSRKGLFIILGVILAVALVGCMGVAAMVNAGGQAAQQTLNQTTTGGTNTNSTQPTNPPATQVAPTPLPTIAPISLSGVGQQASPKFQLQQGLAIFKLTHNGSANFIVQLLDSNGKAIDYLVNEIGSFDGSKAEGNQNAGTYVLDIQADGKWTVTIQQPRPTTAPNTTNFHGKGQAATQLFSMNSGLKTIKMTHDGTSNFIVQILDSNGNVVDIIVNEIGKFNGSKAEGIQNDGIYLFDIQADGNWTISIQ